jgi:molybdopterin converting factor small subunit
VRLTVRYFASLADRAGVKTEIVDVEPGTDVAALWSRLARTRAPLAVVDPRPLAACDLEYADGSRLLDGVREVAFLPPVSGG